MISSDLLPNDLDQHPLPPPTVKLAVKDPFPRAKVQPAVGHRDHNLAPHDLPLHMGVCIVLAGAIVPILVDRRVRRQLFEPHLVIVM